MLKIKKRHLKYLGPILRKIDLENLSFEWHIEGKITVIYLSRLCKWMVERGRRNE